MRIADLTYYLIDLPLRKQIKHASHARRSSENVLVQCRLADGTTGWGEGVPRPYVTGETADGVFVQLAATPLAPQLAGDFSAWDSVLQLCQRLRITVAGDDPRDCRANAHRCALELSILDAFGRWLRRPVSDVSHLFEPSSRVATSIARVQYSGAVTAETPGKEMASALKMRLFGFAHCKVKVGMTGVPEPARLRRIRRLLGRAMDIRLDANEAWCADEAADRLEPLLPYGVSCVEQPVPHEQLESLAELRRRVPVPIMLDESLTSWVDAQTAIRLNSCDLFNLRLSKCGGFLNCLRLAGLAHSVGLGYQLGCHPGESGILSAAGRHFATSVNFLRYREGSYDRYLLRRQITREDITFRYGGWGSALEGPGWGITVDEQAVVRLARRTAQVHVE